MSRSSDAALRVNPCTIVRCDRTCGNWHPYDVCPCPDVRCTVRAVKLTRVGHAAGCICPSCISGRNDRKGKAGQRTTYRHLGGEGPTPRHEEATPAKPVLLRPEVKEGEQVPKTLDELLDLKFVRRAFSQARRSVRIGESVKPSVSFVIPKRRGGGVYVLVELEARKEPGGG